MALRNGERQSDHDGAVNAAKDIYLRNGKACWINPDGFKNRMWAAYYIDVIATDGVTSSTAWVTEIETDDSVSDQEARDQWKDYAAAYSHWHLAVPAGYETEANRLLAKHGISNCNVLPWQKNTDGTFTFWGLPGMT